MQNRRPPVTKRKASIKPIILSFDFLGGGGTTTASVAIIINKNIESNLIAILIIFMIY